MAGADGWPAEQLFGAAQGGPQGLGLDDVALLPADFAGARPGGARPGDTGVDISAKLTRNVTLGLPLVAGPAGTATEAKVAIAMALAGGIGVIHRYQGIEEQAAMVRKVKAHSAGLLLNPATLSPRHTVADAAVVRAEWGCSGIPITDNGKMGGKLVGLVTSRDLEIVKDKNTKLSEVMVRNVASMKVPVTLRQARETMQQKKVGKLPVINEDSELVAFICRGDLKKERAHPTASRDKNMQLLVAAAVGASEESRLERAQMLVEAGVDVLCVDTDGGVSEEGLAFVKQLKQSYGATDVLAGRVATSAQANLLLAAGVDGLLIGGASAPVPPNGGCASACEASLIYELSGSARSNHGVPVVADCGASNFGQVLKALCLGAATVAVDDLLSGTEELFGDSFFYQQGQNGARVKICPSHPALSAPTPFVARRAGPVVELGASGPIVSKGSIKDFLPHMAGKLCVGLAALGIRALSEVPSALRGGTLRLERQLPPAAAAERPRLVKAAASSLHSRW